MHSQSISQLQRRAVHAQNAKTCAHLCLARVALMAGHANLIEQAVQLADDGGDLLGEVAGVHGGCRPASASSFAYAL